MRFTTKNTIKKCFQKVRLAAKVTLRKWVCGRKQIHELEDAYIICTESPVLVTNSTDGTDEHHEDSVMLLGNERSLTFDELESENACLIHTSLKSTEEMECVALGVVETSLTATDSTEESVDLAQSEEILEKSLQDSRDSPLIEPLAVIEETIDETFEHATSISMEASVIISSSEYMTAIAEESVEDEISIHSSWHSCNSQAWSYSEMPMLMDFTNEIISLDIDCQQAIDKLENCMDSTASESTLAVNGPIHLTGHQMKKVCNLRNESLFELPMFPSILFRSLSLPVTNFTPAAFGNSAWFHPERFPRIDYLATIPMFVLHRPALDISCS